MKKLLVILASFLSTIIHAQEIRYENGKFGMISSSGEALLEYEYDHISNVLQFGRKSSYYILRQGKKYGMYSTIDFKSTGCIYDSVFLHLNVLHFRTGKQFGFLAQTDNSYKVIEPQYDELYPMHEVHNTRRHAILSLHNYNISVKKNGLWGIVRHSDGEQVLALKFRYEVFYLDDYFWVMIDTAHTEILINPYTGVEFRNSESGHYVLNEEHTFLLVYDRHIIGAATYRTAVYDYNTGQLIWEKFSDAYRVLPEFVSEEIILLHEEFNRESGLRNVEENRYTFYNVTNGSPLLTHQGGDYCLIEVVDDSNKLIVHATDSYNGRKKEIGQIYK